MKSFDPYELIKS
jgi:phage portal protein BeeE